MPVVAAPRTEISSEAGMEISAQSSIEGTAASIEPFFIGDGGSHIRLAIFAPETQGEVPAFLPLYVQGMLNNNFQRFSAVNLIDRQNLDRIIEEQVIAAGGNFSDHDFIAIGNLTNTQYFLFGTIQRLTGDRYSLQLSITEAETGIRRATSFKSGTLEQLERSGQLINEAAADLLAQMGVQLTERGRYTLLAGNSSLVRAEAGIARGIRAQAQGDEVEALFNITQAVTFDPENHEALTRLASLSTSITTGNVSHRITDDIQARQRWLEVFKETVSFFNDHPPFEITFDPNLIVSNINHARNTANIEMRIALDSSRARFDAINTLLEGLIQTGRREAWGFAAWPLGDITPRTEGTVLFNGRTSFSYKLDAVLLNEDSIEIGNGTITLTTGAMRMMAGRLRPPVGALGTLQFSNVNANELTDNLTVSIVAVNGISSSDIIASGYMRIASGNLERR